MAITYNAKDNVHYCTNAQRLALDITEYDETAKFYELDTKQIYILYEGTWYQM